MTDEPATGGSTYSEMHRRNAIKSIALREKIEALGDTDLMELMEERDSLWMDSECGKEIRAEWAAQARQLLDVLMLDARPGCACDVCAITHGLNAATAAVAAIRDLHNEVDCRVEHGAESGGHLEYVRGRLAAVLRGKDGE